MNCFDFAYVCALCLLWCCVMVHPMYVRSFTFKAPLVSSLTLINSTHVLHFYRDPIFEPLEGKGKTYAEMDKDDKNAISHRGRSFEKFKAFLSTQEFAS